MPTRAVRLVKFITRWLAQPCPSRIQPALNPWRLCANDVVFRCLSTFLSPFFHLPNISLSTQCSRVFTPASPYHLTATLVQSYTGFIQSPQTSCRHDCRLPTGGYRVGDRAARVWERRTRYVGFSCLSTMRLPLSSPPWSSC